MRSFLRFRSAALALLLLAACATAQKKFEEGRTLEERGRASDAAARYVEALKKDPSLAEARARLRETGTRAVGDYLREADAARAAGRADDAADDVLAMEALVRGASGVGVPLDVPADWETRRRETLDAAISAALAAGSSAAGRAEFDQAVRGYERAAGRYQPSHAQRTALDRARHDALLGWAESEAARGAFRSAYERAGLAVAALADSGSALRARQLRADALRRGTREVAALPVAAPENGRAWVPSPFLPLLNEELEEEGWSRPPLFVRVLDAERTGRLGRRHGYGRRLLTADEAARLGRELDVEFVVLTRLDTLHLWESRADSARRAVKTQAGADTAYVLRTGRREAEARVTYFLVDPVTRRVVEERRVSARASAPLRVAAFAGDWRTLAVSRSDRALFEPHRRAEVEREVLRRLAAELGPRLARDVFARITPRID